MVVTLSSVALAEYAWQRERQRALELRVEEFNKAIDERHYDAAYRIALLARSDYPSSPVARLLLEKALFAHQIAYREDLIVGCGCIIGDDDEPTPWP